MKNATKTNALATKTNALATKTNALATKTNAPKTDTILTLAQVTEYIKTETVKYKCKVFTDGTFYVGIGTRSNVFSVNVKKTKYNIYCNDTAYDVCNGLKLKHTEYIKRGNSTDKTRPNYITTNDTNDLKTMFLTVVKMFA